MKCQIREGNVGRAASITSLTRKPINNWPAFIKLYEGPTSQALTSFRQKLPQKRTIKACISQNGKKTSLSADEM